MLELVSRHDWLNRIGEGLFNHETPDGYSMASASWNAPGQMTVRFEIVRQIGSGSADLFKPDVPNAMQRMYGLDAAGVQRIFPGVHPAELGIV